MARPGTPEDEETLIPKDGSTPSEEESFVKRFGLPPFLEEIITNEQKRNVALVISFYFVVSITLVFLNKYILSDDFKIDAPIFLVWTQTTLSLLWCFFIGTFGRRHIEALSFFPPFEYKWVTAVKTMPLTLVFCGMVIFNNLCLKYVEVTFYQIARSLTIVFNILLSYFLLGQSTSKHAIAACGVIVFGYIIGTHGEPKFSTLGAVYGVLSSLFVCLNSIYVSRVLPVVGNNAHRLLIYNNGNATIALPALILLTGEVPVIFKAGQLLTMYAWAVLFATGSFGFLINLATFLQIRHTSPLTHNVSGTAKACVQTVLAWTYYRNPMPFMEVCGLGLSIGGSFAYSLVRMREMDKKKAEQPEAAKTSAMPLPTVSAPQPDVRTVCETEESRPTQTEKHTLAVSEPAPIELVTREQSNSHSPQL